MNMATNKHIRLYSMFNALLNDCHKDFPQHRGRFGMRERATTNFMLQIEYDTFYIDKKGLTDVLRFFNSKCLSDNILKIFLLSRMIWCSSGKVVFGNILADIGNLSEYLLRHITLFQPIRRYQLDASIPTGIAVNSVSITEHHIIWGILSQPCFKEIPRSLLHVIYTIFGMSKTKLMPTMKITDH